jgi:hypothetical protein
MAGSNRSRYALADRGGARVVVDVAGKAVPKELDELSAALRKARRAEQAARERQAPAVLQMRSQGASWAAIGACLGVTREAVFKRYSRVAGDVAGDGPEPGLDDLAAALRKARREEHNARARQALIVQQMRVQGASWAVVAACLGVTREAACKRYSKDQLL